MSDNPFVCPTCGDECDQKFPYEEERLRIPGAARVCLPADDEMVYIHYDD